MSSIGEFEAVVAGLSESRPAPSHGRRALGRVAVLGAGPVGQALACECLAAGCEVTLHAAFSAERAALAGRGAVTVRGAHLVGSYRVAEGSSREPAVRLCASTDEAVAGADAILLATPAVAHATYAGLLAGGLEDDQLVVLVPGRAFGAVEAIRTLRRFGAAARPTVVELASAPYLVEAPEPGALRIAAVKRALAAAALPNRATAEAVDALRSILPMLVPAQGVLATTFADLAGVVHAAPAILGAAAPGTASLREREVASVVQRVDEERRRTAFAFGVRELPPLGEWLAAAYGEEDPYEHVAAGRIGDAQVHDALACSLVPLVSAAQLAGVATPAAHALVDLGSVLAGIDYARHGRTLAGLGLDRFDTEGVRRALDGSDAALLQEALA